MLKWSGWNPQTAKQNSNNIDDMTESLPICQNIGEYLSRASSYDVEVGIAPPVKPSALGVNLLVENSPKVVTMAIKIKNFYDAHG